MKQLVKTSLLIAALAVSQTAPTSAAFVKHARTAEHSDYAAAVAGQAVTTLAESTSTEAAAPTAKKHKKMGLLQRIGRGIRRALAGDNQIIAAILAFFVGYLGIHRFYLGYTTIGIIQAALFIVGFLTSFILIGFPILIGLYIWVLIDFIRILTGSLEPKGGSYSETI